MRGIFAAFALMAMLAGMPARAADWFVETSETMPGLVAAGYQVVGFDVSSEANRIYSDVVAFRYMLQRVTPENGVEVAACTEKTGTGGMMIRQTCYRLARP